MNKTNPSETIQRALSELDDVKQILIDREAEHGSPDENFESIALYGLPTSTSNSPKQTLHL